MLEFRSGRRRVNQSEFLENIKNEAIEAGPKQLERQVHAAAATIVDQKTRKHAEFFVRRRRSPTELPLRKRGSPACIRELGKRLGVSGRWIPSGRAQ